MERRLAAIVAADVVGYSKLIRSDEEGTLSALRTIRENVFDPKIKKHHGRIVKLMGDGILIEFNSALDAVLCCSEVQQILTENRFDDPKIVFRVGINLGDVVVEGDDIHGDGVNVASRLEALSEPGGVCISDAVYEQVRDRLSLSFEDAGKHELKNIDRPVQVWNWSSSSGKTTRNSKESESQASNFDKPSIAVLPFDNMSGDPEQEYFVDGLVEDIITELARFPVLAVISRQSSFVFKQENVDIKDVGEKLGVQYIVEGSVRRAGNRIRVTAQLIDAVTANHIWAERYDRQLDDIFKVQDEVTRAIVAIISAQLGKTVSDNAARKHPGSIKSYEYFLQGNQLYAQFNSDDNLIAMDRYQQAIKLDPEFAPAYAGLSNTYVTDHMLGRKRVKDGMVHGLKNAREALKRDGNNALARICLAWVYIDEGRWDDAEIEFNRVLSLNSGDADILAELGMAQNTLNNFDVGIPLLEEAIRLNPLAPEHYQRWLGTGYYRAERYRDAVVTLRAGRVDGWTYAWLAGSYAQLGELDAAREALDAFVELRRNELQMAGVPTDQITDLWASYKINFRYESDWEHFVEGLRMAGLPE